LIFRVALSLFVVLLLAAPASAQFTTEDLNGLWDVHATRVGAGPSGASGSLQGFVLFSRAGTVLDDQVFDQDEGRLTLRQGNLTVSASGVVTGTLGDGAVTVQARMLADKNTIAGVMTVGAGTEVETQSVFTFSRATEQDFDQSTLAGTWRLQTLLVPEVSTPAAEWVRGQIVVDATGAVTSGFLFGSNPSGSGAVTGGLLTMLPNAHFEGVLELGPLDTDRIVVSGVIRRPNQDSLMFAVASRVGAERHGMMILSREPTGTFAPTDIAGTWDLFSVQANGADGSTGRWLRGTLTVDPLGTITSGLLTDGDGGSFPGLSGALVVAPDGTVAGGLVYDFNAVSIQGDMVSNKSLVFGIDEQFVGNLISNGRFDTPDVSNCFTTLLSSPPGFVWSVIPDGELGVDVVNGARPGLPCWNGASGVTNNPDGIDQSLDIDGASSISQSFATTPGQTYTLMLSYSKNPAFTSAPRRGFVTVTGAGTLVSETLVHDIANSTAIMNWLPFATSFVANSTLTTLTITGDAANGAEGFAVDDVIVIGGTQNRGLLTLMRTTEAPPPSGATVQFGQPSYTVTEGTANAVVTITRSSGTGTVTVPFFTTPGTGQPDQDYKSVSLPVTFTAGITSRTVSVPIVNNTTLDGNRSVLLNLGPPVGNAVLGSPAAASLTILDNDQAGVVRLGASTYSVAESAGSLVVTILRAGSNLAGNVSVSYATGNVSVDPLRAGAAVAAASAVPGQDFTATSSTLTFAAGQTTATVRIPITNDTLAEGPETFTFSLLDPSAGVTLGTPATATVTIVDNDVAGTVKFEKAEYPVNESVESVTLKVVRSGGAASGVTVDFTTQDGTATAGAGEVSEGGDYGRTSGTLTFGAGNTSAIITIPIRQDRLAEGSETFTVVLGNPQGGVALGTPPTARVVIVDDESAFQFSTGTYSVRESVTGAVVTIQRSGALATPATVTFTATPGSAVADVDFRPVSTVVSFAPNVASKTVTVPILNNGLVQGNRTVLLGLGGPTGGAQLGTLASAVLTIVEDDQPGTIKLSAATYTVAETAGSLLVNIVRTGVNLAGNVSVTLTTGNGSALAGLDYTAVATVVTFNAGQATRSVRIPILNDTLAEGNETFTLQLSDPTSGAGLGTPSTATVTIVDDDKGGVVKLSAATYSFSEGAGNVSITVVRSGGVASDVLVDYGFTDVTATAGSDYRGESGTLSFAANQTNATIVVPILQDLLAEGNETFRVTLGNVQGGATLGVPSVATVTIVDDESAIQFGQAGYTGREGAAATVTLVRSGALDTPAAVTVTAAPASPLAGLEFDPVSVPVTFPAKTASRTVSIPLRSNGLVQGNRTLMLTLSNPTGGAQLGTLATATLAVTEGDQGGVIRLASASYVVSEMAGSVVVDILRAGTSLAGNVSVAFSTANGSALAGLDYGFTAGIVTFNAGETKRSVTIPILQDTVVEGTETFSFALSSPTGGATLGTPSSATVAITSEDLGGTVRLSAATYRTIEGAGNFSVTLVRSGGTASAASVDYTVVDNSTTAVAAATFGTVTFGANQMAAAIPIPILQDSLAQGDHTLTITLSNPRGGAALGSPARAVITVVDDEVVIQFSGRFVSGLPEVVRTGPAGAAVSVQYTAISGTAVLGQDFVLADNGTLVFPAGTTAALLPVTIVADILAEGTETFRVTLFNPSPPAQLGPNASAVFSIFDDEFGGRVQFDAPRYTGVEGQTIALTVKRDGGLGTILPVSWSVVGGNASAGTDFSPVSGEVTFGPTELTRTILITLATDQLIEGLEVAQLALHIATGAAELGTNAVATLRIIDAPPTAASTFQFERATHGVTEGGQAAIVITRTGDLSNPASVEFTTSNGTALLGEDYTLVGGSIEFGANSSSATVLAQTVADDVAESPETFSITLRNPSANAALGTPATTVVTITDARPGYTFSLIADDTGTIASFLAPSINNNGAVAFVATLDDGNRSVFTTAPGALTAVASTAGGSFVQFGSRAPLTDDGSVVFRAFPPTGGTAIYQAPGDGGELAPVAVPDASYGGFGEPSVSPAGRVAFRASLVSGSESILAGQVGIGLFTVADTDEPRFDGFGQLAAPGDLDDQVVFLGTEDSGASGLYLSNVDGEEGVITQLVSGTDFDGFAANLTINSEGRVAFLGFPTEGGSGIFVARNGSALTPLVRTGEVFNELGSEDADGTPAINDAGQVAFLAGLVAGGQGIFVGPDPLRDTVIRTGDALLGSTVTGLTLGGMNNLGQIVFRAFLADERTVVVVATPPATGPDQADIAVTKTGSSSTPPVGSDVTFTVTTTNLGPAIATGVQVTDQLPAGYTFVLASASRGAYNAGTGVWAVGTLAANTSATLQITATVLGAGPYTNTATRTASSPADPNAANDSATVTVNPPVFTVTTEGPLVGAGRTIGGRVTLPTPAGTGGVSVALTSDPGGVVTLTPAAVSIPAGATTGNFSVTGVLIGDATIRATASGFTPATAPITVTGSVISLGELPTIGLGQSLSLPISLSTAAPASGVTVNFVSTNPSVTSVTGSVFIPGNARVPAANPQVVGVNVGSAQINATATGFAPDARTANVAVNVTFAPTAFSVVVGTSANITVNLSAPAPPGGLTFNLVTGNTSVATAASPGTVAAGQLSVPVAITGVTVAQTSLQASGAGVTSAVATITVTQPPPIFLNPQTIGRDLQVQPGLTLGAPAAAGGIPVTLTSLEPARLLLATAATGAGNASIVVTVPAGSSSTSAFFIQALDRTGTVTVRATAPGYATRETVMTLAPSGFIISSPGNFPTTTLSTNTNIFLAAVRLNPGSLTWVTSQAVRGGRGAVNVPVTATDVTGGPGVGTITTSPVAFNSGDVSGSTTYNPALPGTSRIEVLAASGFDRPSNAQTITATVSLPAITVPAQTIGGDLQVQTSATLGAPAPPGGVVVTLTSPEPNRLLLSPTATAAGNGSIIVTVPPGAVSSPSFFIQALDRAGTVTLTASAPNFATTPSTMTLVPSGFIISSPGNFPTTTLSTNTTIFLAAVRLNPGTLTWVTSQPVRGGRGPVNVPVIATDVTGGPGVGAITASPVVFDSGDVSGSTTFDPTAAGTARIEVLMAPGFDRPSNAQTVTATVTAPSVTIPVQTIGRDLQVQTVASLEAPAPAGGTAVTLTSAQPSRLLLSTSATGAGAAAITLTVPAGGLNTPAIFIQALDGSGTVTVTASAPNFTATQSTMTLVPSGFIISSPGNFTTSTFSANTSIFLASVRLTPGTLNWVAGQQIRGGRAAVSVPVVATDVSGGQGVGVITSNPVAFGAGASSGSTSFDPLVAGVSRIEVMAPPGFDRPSNAQTVTATVTAPAISVGFTNLEVGRDLQQFVTVSLGATPPSAVTVTVTVGSTAVASITTNGSVAGGSSITFNNVTTANVGGFFVQGRASVGTTTVTAQAAGYADEVATVTARPSGFIISSPGNFTTTAAAPNTTIFVAAVRLEPTTLNWITGQQVRGGVTVSVPVTVADQTGGPGVGAITTTPLTFTGTESSESTAFNPAVPGTAVISVGVPPGFDTPSNARQITATVN
jgi:uncharacterized repeat protein (TIGR01451 family)